MGLSLAAIGTVVFGCGFMLMTQLGVNGGLIGAIIVVAQLLAGEAFSN